MKKPFLKQIEQIKTSEGTLMPLYKDWESWHEGYSIKMSYITTLNPGTKKGPILHNKRRGMMFCVSGNVTVECFFENKIHKFELGNDNCNSLVIPAGIPNMIINNSTKDAAIILNMPDRAWRPDDEDTVKLDSWKSLRRGLDE